MKNKFFINKFLPIISIFLFVVFVASSSVFAYSPSCWSDDVVNRINNTYSKYSSEYKYFICFINYSSQVIMYCWNDDNTFFVQGSLNGLPTLESNQTSNFLGLVLDGNSLSVLSSHKQFNKVGYEVYSSGGNITLHTNTTVYNDYDKTSVFFQLPPQEVEEVEEVKTVTETLVEETMKSQIMDQMKTMIVGFLKYLIALVISLIAFWKGWQFLSTQLRKA